MAASSEHVTRELLALGFRSYPRSILMGFAFACLTVAFVWPGLPHDFLVVWLAALVPISMARLWTARAFLADPAPDGRLPGWVARAALCYGVTGVAWGVLGGAAIHFAQARIEYGLLIAFLICIFAVLQSQVAAAHPTVFRAFVHGAW